MDTSWDSEQVRDRVGKRITEFLQQQRPLLDEVSPDVGSLVDPIGDFLAGGKRLRATFLYWGWRAGGGPDCDEVVSAAAAMELLQAAALVHDDVMDRSDSRRGRPAMHRQFGALHETAGWAGAADDFGAAAAVLVGDLCLVWSDELLTASGLSAAALARGRPVFDAMRSELMAGQYLDVLEQARRNDDVEAALQVATYKSAKYTIERPLHLGAEMAGAAPSVVAGLREYGVSLGRAFQLRDDLLGVFGDPARTGKPSGDDLREGKRTALVALALAALDPASRAELEAGLGDQAAGPADVARLTALLAGTPARRQVEAMIDRYARTARTALDRLAVDDAPRAVLADLITAATDRAA